MKPTLYTVDAFTDRPFAGNPAAVCVVSGEWREQWMRDLAAEMNLSETAFVRPRGDAGADGYDLRWLTPAVEVDLCGHATLASAHALWHFGHLPRGTPARFSTRSGWLSCEPREGGWIEMDFPANPATPADPPAGLVAALGATGPVAVARNQFDFLCELSTERAVRDLAPDFRALRGVKCRGVIVTARADPGAAYDFVSRFFAPGAGIDEDPVTGSAHCCLGPYWAERVGKRALTGYQASRRGGTVRVRPAGERCFLAGQAVAITRSELLA